ncbi:hypothetical protein, partial [Arthrobacter sp. SO3]|uniref:hypothetical protein n=1 Tax=Arthrobacter sp. SO3 TaxID=1897057 RepID=UPI001CFF6B73
MDADDRLHVASSWLGELHDLGRSPNTIKSYASKVAAYLSWTVQTADWRSISMSHLVFWRRTLSNTRAPDMGIRGLAGFPGLAGILRVRGL